jgi:hypothetical protein
MIFRWTGPILLTLAQHNFLAFISVMRENRSDLEGDRLSSGLPTSGLHHKVISCGVRI